MGAEPAGRHPARPGGRAGRVRHPGGRAAAAARGQRQRRAAALRRRGRGARRGGAEAGWSSRDTRLVCAGLVALAVLGAAWAGFVTGTPLAGILLGVLALLLFGGGGAARARPPATCRPAPCWPRWPRWSAAPPRWCCSGPPLGAAHLVLAAAVVVLVAAAGPPGAGRRRRGVPGPRACSGCWPCSAGCWCCWCRPPRPGPRPWSPRSPWPLTTAMPTLALRLSRIPRPPLPRTAADLAEVPGQLELEQVQQRVRRARSLLTGLLVGCYTATALATVVLTTDTGSAWPGVLAAILGVLLLLRGRLFRHRAQVAAPLLAAAVVLRRRAATRPPRPGPPNAPLLLGAVAPVALLLAAVAGGVRPLGRARGRSTRGWPAAWTCWRRCCCCPWCRSCWPCGTSTRCCWSCGRERRPGRAARAGRGALRGDHGDRAGGLGGVQPAGAPGRDADRRTTARTR